MTITEQEIRARVKRDLISLVVFFLALGLWPAVLGAAILFLPKPTTPASDARAWMFALILVLPMMLGFWLFRRYRRQRARTDLGAGFGQYERELESRTFGILVFAGGLCSFLAVVAHMVLDRTVNHLGPMVVVGPAMMGVGLQKMLRRSRKEEVGR
jgi:FtsH-binding integral membrane protein